MKCNFCGCQESRVIDSRDYEDNNSIRRRRECEGCGRRFTTYETIESTPVLVIKNSGERQAFDSNKVKGGIIKACEKRPVSMKTIDQMVADIEKVIYNSLDDEVTTKYIGELVMTRLKNIDEVAYVRFASVYKQFKDATTFFEYLNDFDKLMLEKKEKQPKK
ncbi:MAG: transcriptional regulator NrdR [Clostridia bacterium]